MSSGPTQGDWFAGGTQNSHSNGFASEWTLTPTGLSLPAGVVVTSYEIFQQTGGTGIAVAFYDLDGGPPVDGTAIFNNDPNTDAVFLLPIAAPGTLFTNVGLPGHTYNKTFSAVATTSLTTLTRANASTLFAVHYLVR